MIFFKKETYYERGACCTTIWKMEMKESGCFFRQVPKIIELRSVVAEADANAVAAAVTVAAAAGAEHID